MCYALLVCDWTLPRCLSCTNRRVWPVTNDSSFDESERNGQGVVYYLQNGGVWRGRRNGAGLDIPTRSDALDSEYTAVSGRGPRKCASTVNHAIDYDFQSGQESQNVPAHFT